MKWRSDYDAHYCYNDIYIIHSQNTMRYLPQNKYWSYFISHFNQLSHIKYYVTSYTIELNLELQRFPDISRGADIRDYTVYCTNHIFLANEPRIPVWSGRSSGWLGGRLDHRVTPAVVGVRIHGSGPLSGTFWRMNDLMLK